MLIGVSVRSTDKKFELVKTTSSAVSSVFALQSQRWPFIFLIFLSRNRGSFRKHGWKADTGLGLVNMKQ